MDIERFPLIAPKHNFFINPTGRRGVNPLVYNRQLVYTWTLVGGEDFEEVEAVTGVNLKVTRDFLKRPRQGMADSDILTHPSYEVYKPVTFYTLRKLSSQKILAVAGVRYDKDKGSYITKWGGDGRTHKVPVYWDEYLPVTGKRRMDIAEDNHYDDAKANQHQRIAHVTDVLKDSGMDVYRRHIVSKLQ